MSTGHFDLTEKEKEKLIAYEAREATVEARTEAGRIARADRKQKDEEKKAKRRQSEEEQKIERVKRRRKLQRMAKIAGRILRPKVASELKGDDQRAMQRLNSVSGRA